MLFTIATWNVNSLRVRLLHVLKWLSDKRVDVLAVQETKLMDADFPIAEINQAGYEVVFSGQKTYNGMAILSRQRGTNMLTDIAGFNDPQRRILALTIGDIRVINLYVPNGESVASEKYNYKLAWIKNIRKWLENELTAYPKMIVLGDFNIAPDDRDVYDPRAWEGQVLFSKPERDALEDVMALGLQDCFRLQSQPEKSFSWWDYRMNAFKRNRGLRIDHILASSALSTKCVRCLIDKDPRGWERPSDHAPVIAEFSNRF